MINTTFREQKHRSLPTPIYRSRKPMPLEITTFRVAFVHIDNNSSYDLRKPIYSLLKVYPRTCVSSPRSLSLRKPLLVDNYKSLSPNSIPQAILIIAGYQYKAAFVADQEINMVACLTEIMAGCKFK